MASSSDERCDSDEGPVDPAKGAVDLQEAVAVALVRLGFDTLAPRLLQDVILRDEGWASSPPRAGLLERVLGLTGVPAGERAGRAASLRARAAAALALGHATGLQPISWQHHAYPRLLRCIPDPPVVLWTRGRLEALGQEPAVALVGSRNATPEGLATARRLGRALSEAGVLVVSGLARGIDAAAHRGALDRIGLTVAVLGNGPDAAYPSSHRGLADEVAARGCIISEYPPGTPAFPQHFPLRNRIISGLSRAVVIVQASERSGSLITARMALEQGREVLAVPGAVATGLHRGCHALIKDGARLVETVEDVCEAIGWSPPAPRQAAPEPNPQELQGLAAVLPPGAPVHLDELAERTGRSTPDLLAELTRLELAGTIARTAGGAFVRLD